MSPSKFETLAAPSPTKFSIPSRKVRNQPASRIHDIEFAAEISTSLIAQVRNLQALLAQREEELKEVKSEKSRLEIEAEGFQQRLKSLDESENRYKDENWNLETQIHELLAAQKQAAEREKKLTQTLNVVQAERNAAQRELEEVKDSLAKQDEKYSAEIKNLEIDLGTSRRTAAVFETERSALQKKVEELTSQNQELAKAFSALQRGRTLERETNLGVSSEALHPVPDHNTPEHSPPPSPLKPTPRHSALESETLKTSLGHAQRTIQTLRTNLHREKTEKLELKRMLQDARDEIEKLRSDPQPNPPRRSRKVEARDMKKPSFKLNQLGVPRSSRTEVYVEDPEWEDQSEDTSPRPLSRRGSALRLAGNTSARRESGSDRFGTANETGSAAFESARERRTEAADFQTGIEDLSDGDSATETEGGPSRGADSIKRPPPLPPHESARHYSFDSAASTSSDEDDYIFESEIRTPTAGPRMRMRANRGSPGRRSRRFSEDADPQSSPISIPANGASATPGGQSLYAELNNLDNSDEDSCAGAATPSRRSIRSVTPATPGSVSRGLFSPPPEVPSLPKVMVDSGMMTEPVHIRPLSAAAATREGVSDEGDGSLSSRHRVASPEHPTSPQLLGVERIDGESSRPLSAVSYSDASVQHDWDMDAKLAQLPSPPDAPSVPGTAPSVALQPTLSTSPIRAECIEPRPEADTPSAPLSLSMSSIAFEQTEPVSERIQSPTVISEHLEPAAMSISAVLSQEIEPAPLAMATLSFSTVCTEQVEPIVESETAPPSPIALSCSAVLSQQVEPAEPLAPTVKETQVPEITVTLPPLSFSSIVAEQVEPGRESPTSPVRLSLSPINAEEVEPCREPEPPAPSLTLTTIRALDVPPSESCVPAPALSSIQSWGIEPVEATESPLPALSLSGIATQEIEPTPSAKTEVAPDFRLSHTQLLHPDSAEPRSFKGNASTQPLDVGEGANFTHPKHHTPESVVRGRDSRILTGESEAVSLGKRSLTSADRGAQTTLTSEAIEKMVGGKPLTSVVGPEMSKSLGSMDTPSAMSISRLCQESFETPLRSKDKLSEFGVDALDSPLLRKSGSSVSGMDSVDDVPPLPSNHREAIEAARNGSSHGGQGSIGNMAPPSFSASTLKPQSQSLRPRTPPGTRRPVSPVSVASGRGTPTPRAAARAGVTSGAAELQSLSKTASRSRKSSVSSFTSEMDTRFNMHHEGGFDAQGLEPNTDPRMIQAITQTMIGEYLWKYTRKTGRGEMSENRHRRYFWVHPYTRTLYWSDRDPSTAGRSELRAKSVQIEAVRVVADDNPMPPGLHRKSLVIVSPGRSIKFTCTTGQRHETWFNALSYLLLRTASEGQSDAEEMAGHLTREDVEEFNPSFGRRPQNGKRPAPSLSSYNSRTVRDSPTMDLSMSVPTLTPSRSKAPHGRTSGTLSRISGYWKDSKLSGTFGSIRSRSVPGRDTVQGIYEASEVQDSAEDVRQMIERQDREADRLENVRACCDGKSYCLDKAQCATQILTAEQASMMLAPSLIVRNGTVILQACARLPPVPRQPHHQSGP